MFCPKIYFSTILIKKNPKKTFKIQKRIFQKHLQKDPKKKNKFGEIFFSLSQITLTSKIKVQNHHHRTHLVK
jgi:hypothetical protein